PTSPYLIVKCFSSKTAGGSDTATSTPCGAAQGPSTGTSTMAVESAAWMGAGWIAPIVARSGLWVAIAFLDSGQWTTTSVPSARTYERLMRANSSSGFRLFICSLTRRRISTAYSTYSSNSETDASPDG